MSTHRNSRVDGGWLVRVVLFAPFYAVYVFVRVWRFLRRVRKQWTAARLALRDTIDCPNGHPNSTLGRFACASCHGTYHGWVGRCELCSAPARAMTCEVCEATLLLPWN